MIATEHFTFTEKRPTIGELVPQYTTIGFPANKAVRYIVESHLASRNARGKGNKAAKRQARIETFKWFDEVAGLSEAHIDAMSERWSESRIFQPTHPNIHA